MCLRWLEFDSDEGVLLISTGGQITTPHGPKTSRSRCAQSKIKSRRLLPQWRLTLNPHNIEVLVIFPFWGPGDIPVQNCNSWVQSLEISRFRIQMLLECPESMGFKTSQLNRPGTKNSKATDVLNPFSSTTLSGMVLTATPMVNDWVYHVQTILPGFPHSPGKQRTRQGAQDWSAQSLSPCFSGAQSSSSSWSLQSSQSWLW